MTTEKYAHETRKRLLAVALSSEGSSSTLIDAYAEHVKNTPPELKEREIEQIKGYWHALMDIRDDMPRKLREDIKRLRDRHTPYAILDALKADILQEPKSKYQDKMLTLLTRALSTWPR